MVEAQARYTCPVSLQIHTDTKEKIIESDDNDMAFVTKSQVGET